MSHEGQPVLEPIIRRYLGTVPCEIHHPSPGAPLPQVETGIVFVIAFWSGQSLASLRMLGQVLRAYGEWPPSLFVVDTDELPHEAWTPLGVRPAGAGETFWIRDGRVIARTTGCRPEIAIEMRENTARLYEQPTA